MTYTEPQLTDGLLTTKQAVNRINASGRLQQPIITSRWDYITRSRGIEPDGRISIASLWRSQTVERVLEILLAIETQKASIVNRQWRLRKPVKSKKSRKFHAEQAADVQAIDPSADTATVSA